jgi:hypothetical protein
LALNLKINPLAMMPGAKLMKQGSSESPSPVTDKLLVDDVVSSAKTAEVPSKESSTPPDDSPTSPNVKKLALGLNINPLMTMIPGAKQIKQKSIDNKPEESPTPRYVHKYEISQFVVIMHQFITF